MSWKKDGGPGPSGAAELLSLGSPRCGIQGVFALWELPAVSGKHEPLDGYEQWAAAPAVHQGAASAETWSFRTISGANYTAWPKEKGTHPKTPSFRMFFRPHVFLEDDRSPLSFQV